MYEYGVSFKSVRHLQGYGRFHFYSRYVIVFKHWREVLGAHGLSGHLAKRRNPILLAVSPVSQNLYVESLNQIYIFLARKYASFGHSALLSQSFRKVVAFESIVRLVTPKNFVDFHFAATQIFTECFDLVQISQHNGNDRMIPFYWYVLCMGRLLCLHASDVLFMGCDSHFGTQKNYATTTERFVWLSPVWMHIIKTHPFHIRSCWSILTGKVDVFVITFCN